MPLENPHVLQECFSSIVQKLNSINNPFEQSLFALVQFSYLQAFEDVNKRTARLLANIPFIKHNLRPLSFTDIQQSAYTKALLGIYEKNDISIIKDLYIWAYNRSAQKYSAIQQVMGAPNILKLKYRSFIHKTMHDIILQKIVKQDLVAYIRNLIKIQQLEEPEATQLFQAIEAEVLSLHDGNIARFKVLPSEFEAWKNQK